MNCVLKKSCAGTLNHAAVENWHRQSRGHLADIDKLPLSLQDLAMCFKDVLPALMDLDAHPLQVRLGGSATSWTTH